MRRSAQARRSHSRRELKLGRSDLGDAVQDGHAPNPVQPPDTMTT
jgi:hypothetical protein